MHPLICNYYLTYRCNARCGFCAIWRRRGIPASAEADPDTVARNLADLRIAGVKVVDFTGGEPLLYEGLPVVLRAAKNAGLRTTVTTNGILYPERARELAGLVDILQFSLQGPDAATHDKVTVTPSFRRIVESIRAARDLRVRPTFIHTVTDDNLDRVPRVIELARALAVPVMLNPAFSYPGIGGLSLRGLETLDRLARGPRVNIDRGYLRFCRDGGNRMAAPRCLAVDSTIVISPDDRLILPCFHHAVRSIPIRGRLTEVLAGEARTAESARQGRHPFCAGCTVYCYLRASLFRRMDRYWLPSILSAAVYLFELARTPRRNRPGTDWEHIGGNSTPALTLIKQPRGAGSRGRSRKAELPD